MTFLFTRHPFCRMHQNSTAFFGLLVVCAPSAALAQDTPVNTTLAPIVITGAGQTISEDNDTIVPTRAITALKTDTPLVETPRSISVVTREEIEQRGATDLIQATRYSSGVNTGGFGFDPRFDQVTIRGI